MDNQSLIDKNNLDEQIQQQIFELKKELIMTKDDYQRKLEETEERNGNLIRLNKNLEKEKKSLEKDFKKLQKEFDKLLKDIRTNYRKIFSPT